MVPNYSVFQVNKAYSSILVIVLILNLLFLCSSSSYSVLNCLCRWEIPMRKKLCNVEYCYLPIDYWFSSWIHTSVSQWTIAHCFDFWVRTGSVRLPGRSLESLLSGWSLGSLLSGRSLGSLLSGRSLGSLLSGRSLGSLLSGRCRGLILSGRGLRSTLSGRSQGPTLSEGNLGLNGVRGESRAHLVTEESWANLEREDFKAQLVR